MYVCVRESVYVFDVCDCVYTPRKERGRERERKIERDTNEVKYEQTDKLRIIAPIIPHFLSYRDGRSPKVLRNLNQPCICFCHRQHLTLLAAIVCVIALARLHHHRKIPFLDFWFLWQPGKQDAVYSLLNLPSAQAQPGERRCLQTQ